MLWAEISYTPLVRIEIGPLDVSPHGIFTAVGFVFGAWWFLRDARRAGLPEDDLVAVLYRSGIGGIVGARFFYVLNHFSSYESPVEWLEVWEGGISLLGGLTGALIVAWWSARRRGVDFWAGLDLAAPWLPLGIAVGRIGDIVIADHLGQTTDVPWGYRCPEVVDIGRTVGSPCPPGEVVHLTAAYDLLLSLGLFGIMLLARRRWAARRGVMGALLVVLYGLNRVVLDFARADDRRWALTGSQWGGLAAIVVGAAGLAWRASRRPAPEGEVGATALGGEGAQDCTDGRPPSSAPRG
jgi:phosphatidylglycerol:prolipoprotein diacylglycerol transferase